MLQRPGAPVCVAALLLSAALAGHAPPSVASAAIAIPGSSLSLGMRLTRVDSLVSFRGGRPTSANRRSGLTRFFGIDANTSLEFEAGRLTHAKFEMQDVSTHSRDYVEDQLRRQGLKPRCNRRDEQAIECDWDAACRLHVSWAPGKLSADARAPEGWSAVDSLVSSGDARAATPAGAAPGAAAAGTGAAAAGGAGIAALQPRPPVVTTSGSSAAPPPAHPVAAGAGAPASLALLGDTLFIGYPVDISRTHRARTQVPPPDPVYPEAARSAGVQGIVRLLATVDTRGMVTKMETLHGIPELDAAARDATRGCRFVPIGPPGMPQGFQVVVQVRFTR